MAKGGQRGGAKVQGNELGESANQYYFNSNRINSLNKILLNKIKGQSELKRNNTPRDIGDCHRGANLTNQIQDNGSFFQD